MKILTPAAEMNDTCELVSLVTPCYNTATYIPRLMESVLFQTYPRIQMIVIDDGSEDDSSSVVSSYIPKFESRGYSLTLLRQKNKGQSAAIYHALPLVKGKYFAWPDSDDYYESGDAIAKMVNALQSAGEGFAIARTQARRTLDGSGELVRIQGLNVKKYEEHSLFEDCLRCRNGWFFCSGAYLIDFEVFKGLTNLQIYHKYGTGQNYQLLLPMLYNYRCVSISEPLYTIVKRKGSHGDNHSFFTAIIRKYQYIDLLMTTLWNIKSMPLKEKIHYAWRVIRMFDLLLGVLPRKIRTNSLQETITKFFR